MTASTPSNQVVPASLLADGLATVKEGYEFLALSRSKLYELMDAGELPYVRIGRSRRIPKRALIELAARNLVGGDASGQEVNA